MQTIDAKSLPRLGELLWAYRRALDRLEFCLAIQLRLSADGDSRWGGHVADLVAEVAERIGLIDLERDVILGDELLRLRDIITRVPEPWSAIFTDHEQELQAVTERIQRLMARHEIALDEHRASLQRLTDLVSPTPSTQTYDQRGRTQTSIDRSAVLFDGRA
jgi:hypothetical protein